MTEATNRDVLQQLSDAQRTAAAGDLPPIAPAEPDQAEAPLPEEPTAKTTPRVSRTTAKAAADTKS